MVALRVHDCMVDIVVSCPPQASLEEAAHLMWTADCGVLPVVDAAERVVGVVTDRDLAMAAYIADKPLRDLSVAHCMSHTLHTCHRADSLEQAIRTLGEHGIRRLPVVDEGGMLEGILALNDVVRSVSSIGETREKARLSGLLLSAMASICAPRSADLVEPAPLPTPVRKRKTALVKT